MEKKMTKKEMFAQILAHTTDTAERDFIQHEIDLLDKKRESGVKKQTPVQKANEDLKAVILQYLEDKGEPMTITQMGKEIPQCAELSNQKISALVTQLLNAFLVKRETVKGTAYFSMPQS